MQPEDPFKNNTENILKSMGHKNNESEFLYLYLDQAQGFKKMTISFPVSQGTYPFNYCPVLLR